MNKTKNARLVVKAEYDGGQTLAFKMTLDDISSDRNFTVIREGIDANSFFTLQRPVHWQVQERSDGFVFVAAIIASPHELRLLIEGDESLKALPTDRPDRVIFETRVLGDIAPLRSMGVTEPYDRLCSAGSVTESAFAETLADSTNHIGQMRSFRPVSVNEPAVAAAVFDVKTIYEFAHLLMSMLLRSGLNGTVRFIEDKRTLQLGPNQYLNLDEYFRKLSKASLEERRRVVNEAVEEARRTLEVPADTVALKSGLQPRIRHRSDLSNSELERILTKPNDAMPVFARFTDDLSITLDYTTWGTPTALSPEIAKRHRLNIDDALRVATRNLERSVGDVPPVPTGRKGVFMWYSTDKHNTARILLSRRIRRLPVKGRHVAVIPDSYRLLVTGSQDNEGLEFITKELKEAVTREDFLSARPLELKNGTWVPFTLPRKHKWYNRFRYLGLLHQSRYYSRQKRILDSVYRLLDEPIFVAEYMIGFDGATDAFYSTCSLPTDLRSLIPQTDRICVHIRTKDELAIASSVMVDWGDITRVCPDLFLQQDTYPSRYLAQIRTDEGELEAILALRQYVDNTDEMAVVLH